jgi:hypothetical protein
LSNQEIKKTKLGITFSKDLQNRKISIVKVSNRSESVKHAEIGDYILEIHVHGVLGKFPSKDYYQQINIVDQGFGVLTTPSNEYVQIIVIMAGFVLPEKKIYD